VTSAVPVAAGVAAGTEKTKWSGRTNLLRRRGIATSEIFFLSFLTKHSSRVRVLFIRLGGSHCCGPAGLERGAVP